MATLTFAAFFRDRRCQLLGLTVMLAVVLAFFAVPDKQAITLVSHFGYWCVLMAFVLWLRALGQTLAADVGKWCWRTIDW